MSRDLAVVAMEAPMATRVKQSLMFPRGNVFTDA
jgi:hypothetical protein